VYDETCLDAILCYVILLLDLRSCSVYRDDDAAIAIDREEHMLKWMEDDAQNLWIDRYDVRSVNL
jgi:hypothetical protein